MPGMASWKKLYQLEYEQLFEEGYPVGDNPKPDMTEAYIPLPEHEKKRLAESNADEALWEQAYHNLWAVRDKGIRPDFPFTEPNDFEKITEQSTQPPELQPLSDQEYERRISGAWHGRCAGVILGKPVEMVLKNDIEEYLRSVDQWPLNDYIPFRSSTTGKELKCFDSCKGNISYVAVDDDVSYTVSALRLIEKHGLSFTATDVCMNWLANLPYGRLYSCTKQAYYNLISLTDDRPKEEQIAELPLKLNPMREGINAAIRADLFGYIAPADPIRAAGLAWREASANSTKNGIYGATFVAACISAALSKNPTIDTILAAGLSVVPAKSRLAEAIARTRSWYEQHHDWEPVCRGIYETYGHLGWAGAMYNIPIVVLALLHGNLDFTRTITTAVMCGVDTDCNAGTAGSIVGAAIGIDRIEPRWYSVFNDQVKTFVAGNGGGDGTITDLVRRTVACCHQARSA